MNHASRTEQGLRLSGVVMLIVFGLFTSLCVFPFCDDRRRMVLKARWSAALLRTMGVEADVDLSHAVPGAMLVANHISWVDVFVINAALPCAFVAKEEVRQWPFLGWLSEKNDTVFMRRGSRGHARIINGEIAAILGEGKHVAVFPEGTTTDGRSIRHFHAALLQAAVETGRPVVPMAISYWEIDGQRSMAPRYDGEITFWQCMMAMIGRKRLIARAVTMPPLGLCGEDRRHIAVAARAAIASSAGLLLNDAPDICVGVQPEDTSTGHSEEAANPVSTRQS